jgi:uncharacterized protein (TIGR03643 family)
MPDLELENINRIIEMAWEDRTPFESIESQFGVTERELKRSSFKMWRKRVNECVSKKHLKKRNPEITRFKSRMQKNLMYNKA